MRDWMVAHARPTTGTKGPGKYSPTRTNGAITVLRELLAIAKRDKVMTEDDVVDALRGMPIQGFPRTRFAELAALPPPITLDLAGTSKTLRTRDCRSHIQL